MKLLNLKSIFALLFVLVLLSSDSLAQGLFTEIPDNAAGLSAAQMQKLTLLRSKEIYESVKCIQVGSLKDLQNKGKIDFNLPGHSGVLSADPFRIAFENDSNYTYKAKFKGIDGLDGDMQFSRDNGEYFGRITPYDSHEIYEVFSLGQAKHILIKYSDASI